MRYTIFLFILAISACGNRYSIINNEFLSYIYEFEEIADVKINYSIIFSALDSSTLGKCVIREKKDVLGNVSEYKTVYINEDKWYQFSDIEKRSIIFHELGHCSLYLSHDGGLLRDGCPS